MASGPWKAQAWAAMRPTSGQQQRSLQLLQIQACFRSCTRPTM